MSACAMGFQRFGAHILHVELSAMVSNAVPFSVMLLMTFVDAFGEASRHIRVMEVLCETLQFGRICTEPLAVG